MARGLISSIPASEAESFVNGTHPGANPNYDGGMSGGNGWPSDNGGGDPIDGYAPKPPAPTIKRETGGVVTPPQITTTSVPLREQYPLLKPDELSGDDYKARYAAQQEYARTHPGRFDAPRPDKSQKVTSGYGLSVAEGPLNARQGPGEESFADRSYDEINNTGILAQPDSGNYNATHPAPAPGTLHAGESEAQYEARNNPVGAVQNLSRQPGVGGPQPEIAPQTPLSR